MRNSQFVVHKTFFIFTVLIILFGCTPAGETWQRIEASGTLRVGLDPTYPPFEMADGVPLQGLDVDLARAIAADLGLETSFTYFGYDGLYDALATEQVDVLISALVIRPGQTEDVAYSDPYFNAGQILIVPEGDTTITRMEDLDGHTLAVELGAEGHVVATRWERRLPDLTVAPHNTPAGALDAVANGEADATLVDSISGRLYLAENDGLATAGKPVTVEPFALAVRKEDELLLQKLNESLDRLQASGRVDEITANWLGE